VAAGRVEAAGPSGAAAEAFLTQARVVYVAVVADGRGYLEPAYLYTGGVRSAAGTSEARLLVPALAASALR
jgi:hypothetical protein